MQISYEQSNNDAFSLFSQGEEILYGQLRETWWEMTKWASKIIWKCNAQDRKVCKTNNKTISLNTKIVIYNRPSKDGYENIQGYLKAYLYRTYICKSWLYTVGYCMIACFCIIFLDHAKFVFFLNKCRPIVATKKVTRLGIIKSTPFWCYIMFKPE